MQALTAEAKGIAVIKITLEQVTTPLLIEKYFDANTMSVHLKENCTPKAKIGRPGQWDYKVLSDELLSASAQLDDVHF